MNNLNHVVVVKDVESLVEEYNDFKYYAIILTPQGSLTLPCDTYISDGLDITLMKACKGEFDENNNQLYEPLYCFSKAYVHYYIIPRESGVLMTRDNFESRELHVVKAQQNWKLRYEAAQKKEGEKRGGWEDL